MKAIVKAVVEIHMPDCCVVCPLFNSYVVWCGAVPQDLEGEDVSVTKPSWCPLTEVIMTERINKCPHCDSVGKVGSSDRLTDQYVQFQVICTHCGVRGPRHKINTKAISLWNMMLIKDYSEHGEDE